MHLVSAEETFLIICQYLNFSIFGVFLQLSSIFTKPLHTVEFCKYSADQLPPAHPSHSNTSLNIKKLKIEDKLILYPFMLSSEGIYSDLN